MSGSHCLHSLYSPNHASAPLLDLLCWPGSFSEISVDCQGHMALTVAVVGLQNREKDGAIAMNELAMVLAPS